MSDRDYSLPEVLDAHAKAKAMGLHTFIPGYVVTYNAATQTATIKAGVQQPLEKSDGDVTHVAFPDFFDVPICWPSGGGYFAAFGLVPGDPVAIHFSEIAMGEYLSTGQVSKPVDTRRHSLGYPYAVPGGARPDSKALVDAPITGVVIGKDSDENQIHIDGTAIKLGKTATDFVALASKVLTELTDIKNAFDTHTHSGVTTGTGVSGAPSIPMPAPNSVAATNTKAK